MKFKNISSEEKEKLANKIIDYVQKKVENEDATYGELYLACKMAGGIDLYDFICEKVEE